jgi:hypothetical protein
MTPTTRPSDHGNDLARAAAALAAALVPVLAGLTLLCSDRARQAAINLFGGKHTAPAATPQLAKLWGVGLLIIGALQALGSLALAIPITDPTGILLRTLFALAAEALLVLATRSAPRRARAG